MSVAVGKGDIKMSQSCRLVRKLAKDEWSELWMDDDWREVQVDDESSA